MIKKCVICGKEFKCSPSDKKVTCSSDCRSIRASRTHKGKRNKWSEASKEKLRGKGLTNNLQKGTPAAQKSPKSGRYETNVNAKNWHLISPDGKHYCFRSLNFWLRENCEELFDCAPDSAQFRNITSGLSRVKRCVMGQLPPDQRPGYTYKGWTVVPTGDDITDLAPYRQKKSK